ncbi:MAG: Asp-tRNA(Asn)/Glu-tRNA(Gln) amidotransferase subunit GatC [Gemmataceae bacterium]|nr:Asp-tRNA(Asn)/Glu-tRNA(Gln) amidotransferase subunit GatC [Gemmataceae bacterium]MDW8243061.1 Asp-tRNA(Asn)/Glu-tRNA(Gln) amidotransferase subunit GatC [Thermogemmata sp.]
MSLSREEVLKVARLARLELAEAEVAAFQAQLSAILDYVAQLQQLDTVAVEELAHPLPLTNVFRPDEERPSLSVEEALQNAPQRLGDYFAVPAILGSDEGPVSH